MIQTLLPCCGGTCTCTLKAGQTELQGGATTPIGQKQIGKLFQDGSLDQDGTIQIHQRDQRKQVLDPIWELQQEES